MLRSVLYAVRLLRENKVKSEDLLHQLRDLLPDYMSKTAKARHDESLNAMVLRDLVRREQA